MAVDEVKEGSAEKSNEDSADQHQPQLEDLKSSYLERVDGLNSEQKQRVLDYVEDKVRDSSSWKLLKDLRLSIEEDGVSITRKGPTPADMSKDATAVAENTAEVGSKQAKGEKV